jgi:hypothetical protein
LVVKRSQCSCTKKKWANSALARDTATNQGATSAKNSSPPRSSSSRRSIAQSRRTST